MSDKYSEQDSQSTTPDDGTSQRHTSGGSFTSLASQPVNPEALARRPSFILWPRRHPMVSLLIVAVVVAAGYWFSRGDSAPQNRPLMATVAYNNIENTVTAAGSLQPRDYVDVGAQVSGQLEELFVEVGDEVEAGQLLAQIDATVQVQRVEASKASLRAQEAQLDSRISAVKLAKDNAARQEMLRKEQATSQQEFDNAINTLVSAEAAEAQLRAQIEQSKASLASEEAELGYTKIYAPIKGTVVSIAMKEGQTLNAMQQAPIVMRIADLTTMTVQTDVSEADVGKLRKGMEVYFTTLGGGNRRWYSTLRQILPTPTNVNNVILYTALFDIENSDSALLSSMTAQVFFVTSSARNVLTVPMGAVTFASEGGPRSEGNTQNTGGPNGAPTGSAPNNAMVIPGPPTGGFPGGANGSFDPSQITPEMRERFRAMRESGGSGGFNPNNIPPEMRERFQARMNGGGAATVGSDSRPRKATVKVVNAKGVQEEREIMVGVTSRVLAEVISGLKEGEEVVAGIVQPQSAAPTNNNSNGGRPPFMRF